MKKFIYFIYILIFFTNAFAEKIFIGTDTMGNHKGTCYLVLNDDNTGYIFFGGGSVGSGSFSYKQHRNTITFSCQNIFYEIEDFGDTARGPYTDKKRSGVQNSGILNLKKIEQKDFKIYEKYFYAIRYESAWNEDNNMRQKLFDLFHPTGTAKQVIVDDVIIEHDNKGNSIKETYIATLYWEGPMQSGSTKFSQVHHAVLDKWDNVKFISTTGLTNDDAADMVGGFIEGFLWGLGLGL